MDDVVGAVLGADRSSEHAQHPSSGPLRTALDIDGHIRFIVLRWTFEVPSGLVGEPMKTEPF